MARLRPVPAAHYASSATFVHKDFHNCTHSFSVRTQHSGFWSPLTAAPTRSSRGDRKQCSSLCVANPSRCLPTGSSQPTCWTRPAVQASYSTPWPAQPQTKHHLQLQRLHAPVAMFASPHASIPKQHFPWGGGGDVWISQSQSQSQSD
jgi:hypothetical protein